MELVGRNKMDSAVDFLQQEVYVPGFMTIKNFSYSNNMGYFEFNPVEFKVSPLGSIDYLTPRGLHLCISQSTYSLMEELIENLDFGFEKSYLREVVTQGRIKIKKLFQDFRREVKSNQLLEGKVELVDFRTGRMPLLVFDFNFGNKSILGWTKNVIAPNSLPQTNINLTRLNR